MSTRETVPVDLGWLKWLLLWLFLAALVIFGFGSLNVPLFNHMIARGVQTQATAVKLTPEMHNTVCYEYQVGGTKYEGQTQPWGPNPPTEEIKVGQHLVVYYDPLNPASSVLGDPKPMLTNERMTIGLGVLLFPTFIVIILISKQNRKRSG